MIRFAFTPLVLLLLSFNSLSQSSREEFSGMRAVAVKRENITAAQTVQDLVPDCPTHWKDVLRIHSFTIRGYYKGEELVASSTGESLSEKQKRILETCDLGTVLSVEIWFRWKDTLSAAAGYGKLQQMNEYRLAVVPDVEARFAGGAGSARSYMQENIVTKIIEVSGGKVPFYKDGMFTVDEEGRVTDFVLFGKNDTVTDKLVTEAMIKMPKWQAAENAYGLKVKQVFRFSLVIPAKEGRKTLNGRAGC